MRAAALILVCLVSLGPVAAGAQDEHAHGGGDAGGVGKVYFPVTCAPGVQRDFNRAVALLHSFFYEESERQFSAVAARDPACAMAWWGVAMSLWHPLWEPPDSASLARGWVAIQRADSIGPATDRERSYVAALAEFYRDAGHRDHRTRAVAYEHAMDRLRMQFPADTEAAIFYGLALNATLKYSDKTYSQQRRAGEILEPIYARQPFHPGVAHYLIHSYDFPALASRGLPMAQRYADIAPKVPHALHMPSHIFTRLGIWDEAIRSNLAAAQAAREYSAARYGGAVYYDAVHAWDYLEYAYLQKAQDRQARAIRDSVVAIRRVSHQTQSFLYALTAVPARYALEHHAWSDAAALELPSGWNYDRFPWTAATTEFARALGGARSGRLDTARESISKLATMRDRIVNPAFQFWADQVEAQRRTAAAWLALAEGREAEALEGMRAAAALEDSTEKRPVTPGAVLPARELLGDMLLQLRRPAEALAEYQAVLHDAPGRFNALAGASRAALECRRRDEAQRYAAELIELAKDGDGDRPELAAAQRLAGGANGAR